MSEERLKKVESDDNAFHTLAYNTYAQLPYTLTVIQDLYVKGYYLEAIILLRHIIENFGKLRYFVLHKDLVKQHLNLTVKVFWSILYGVKLVPHKSIT